MKISLRLPGGGTLEFEGDAEEFQRVSDFLGDPPSALTEPGLPAATSAGRGGAFAADLVSSDADVELEGVLPLDSRNAALRIESVGATTDMERVTVLAQLAVEAGEDGLDYPTVDRLYTELGYRKPARFPKTFSNAKNAGLVRSVKYGVWRPTVKGENYARGLGRARDAGRRPQPRTRRIETGDADD
jgi:hypothetical protein